jgi:hypothetical protein
VVAHGNPATQYRNGSTILVVHGYVDDVCDVPFKVQLILTV